MEIFFSILSLILTIYALVKINKLESRLKESPTPQPLQTGIVKTIINEPEGRLSKSSAPSPLPVQDDVLQRFFKWYAHEWPLKTGAFFILMGFVWLVTYAFLNNWIGPVGRITFGIVMGALILLAGELRLKKIRTQGLVLVGLGASIMIITIYSAQNVYHMFHPGIALGMIFMISLLTTVISLRHTAFSLSLISLVIASVAPILIGSTEKNILSLYLYLLAVTISTIWIARYSKWRVLILVNIFIITIYSVEFFITDIRSLIANYSPKEILQIKSIAVTFCSIFYFATLASLITNRKPAREDLISATAVGIFTMLWVNGLVRPEYKSVATLIAALFYVFGAFAVFVKTGVKQGVYIYTGVATILLAIATAFEFEGPVLAIAFSLQALILPILTIRLIGKETGKYMLFYFILPLLSSLPYLPLFDYQSYALFSNEFATLTVVTIAFLIEGVYLYYKADDEKRTLHSPAIILVMIGAVWGLIWIWKFFDLVIANDYYVSMTSLFVYTVIGLLTYLIGDMQKRKIMYRFGIFVLIFVVGRLLTVDIWTMELTTRIITFFLIGILFMASVLLRKRKTQ